MNQYYPQYGAAGGVAYSYPTYYPYPTPETRDQFIRRYVQAQIELGRGSMLDLVSEARVLWDESIKAKDVK